MTFAFEIQNVPSFLRYFEIYLKTVGRLSNLQDGWFDYVLIVYIFDPNSAELDSVIDLRFPLCLVKM